MPGMCGAVLSTPALRAQCVPAPSPGRRTQAARRGPARPRVDSVRPAWSTEDCGDSEGPGALGGLRLASSQGERGPEQEGQQLGRMSPQPL